MVSECGFLRLRIKPARLRREVPARGKALVLTDLSIAVPAGTCARIANHLISGLAWKHQIDVGVDVIDADCRGPVGVILFNYSDVDFEVKVFLSLDRQDHVPTQI